MSKITLIENMDQLVEFFQEWHSLRVQGLEMILQADEGTVIQTEDDLLTLQGDTLQAFRTGVQLCLELFRKNPLVVAHDPHRQGNYVH